ncbi:MAG: 30S ribosomal protein S17 [Elusimicrobia bacterium RIFCSPLOWO2_12_FULL_59_9]|nr:MAG: 30S ribosomal protein S17 [Elusimicrobia bacterium RIFCSPLOWO2_12_FULL_59_9]
MQTKPAGGAQPDSAADRNKRHVLRGIVVSDKMNKTRSVVVIRKGRHRLYRKVQTKKSKFYVHDENNQSKQNDVVEIMETRPLSHLKRWRLVRVVERAQQG